jgi:hypothetical protein
MVLKVPQNQASTQSLAEAEAGAERRLLLLVQLGVVPYMVVEVVAQVPVPEITQAVLEVPGVLMR